MNPTASCSPLTAYSQHLEQRHLASSSIRQTIIILEWFLSWLDDTDLRDVILEHIERYRERLSRQRKLNGESTTLMYQNRQVRVIAAFFEFLFQRKKILVNPCAELPPLRDPKRLPRGIISAAQVMRLLQQPNTLNPVGFRDRTLLELLYSSGLRGNEACRLTIYDLDLEDRTLRVVQGKGKKDRVVPIGKVAVHYLREYIEKVRPILLQKNRRKKDVEKLFLSSWGTAMNTALLWRIISHYRKAAGLPETATTHSLRHACATEMLRGGASIRHVQEMLGHARITTTQIYTRVVPIDLKKVHRRTSPSERRKNVEVPSFQNRGWMIEKKRKEKIAFPS